MQLVVRSRVLHAALVWCALSTAAPFVLAQTASTPPRDPGVRVPEIDWNKIGGLGCPNPGLMPLPGLTAAEEKLFCAGATEFAKEDAVKDDGLGPTFNFISCFGCHQYPRSGGTSPLGFNPQYDFANDKSRAGANGIPSFVRPDGPVTIARFKRHLDDSGTPLDGGVHSLFTIQGLPGADGCTLKQPDFAKEQARNNLIKRIPTPTFGAGLIEQIDDDTIENNLKAPYENPSVRVGGRVNRVQPFRVNGSVNKNGNDGTIARFGWKAQNKSLLVFAGEAYNVEMGISNEIFPTEREEKRECQFHSIPNDTSRPENILENDVDKRLDAFSDVEKFAAFMRFLVPPTPSTTSPGGAPSIARGSKLFGEVGCSACHSRQLQTSPLSRVAALRNKPVRLFSDLALHKMGTLADEISQGEAKGDEFRTAPLWGLGQRVFFLHDGRTKDLHEAIELHHSNGSDANGVIDNYRGLKLDERQDIINFLRSL